MGSVQLYRIVDALLDTDIALSYAWKGADVIPPRTLPPQALVIGLTPLLDERSVGALLDLRARGFDLAIVDVSPLPAAGTRSPRAALAPGPGPPPRSAQARVPAAWSGSRRMAGRGGARAGDRGGETISALRTSRPRLIVAAASVAVSAVLAADAWLLSARWEDTIAGTAAAGVGILAVSLTVRFSPGARWASHSSQAATRPRWKPRGRRRSLGHPVALFFLAAELAYWSLELSPGFIRRSGLVVRRVLFLAVGASQPLHLPPRARGGTRTAPRGLVVLALGVGGAILAMGVIAVLVRRSQPR